MIKCSMLWLLEPDIFWKNLIKFLQELVGGRLILVIERSEAADRSRFVGLDLQDGVTILWFEKALDATIDEV
jgi:hypothetical protein